MLRRRGGLGADGGESTPQHDRPPSPDCFVSGNDDGCGMLRRREVVLVRMEANRLLSMTPLPRPWVPACAGKTEGVARERRWCVGCHRHGSPPSQSSPVNGEEVLQRSAYGRITAGGELPLQEEQGVVRGMHGLGCFVGGGGLGADGGQPTPQHDTAAPPLGSRLRGKDEVGGSRTAPYGMGRRLVRVGSKSGMGTRTCSMVSRLRMVTASSSSTVWKSTVTQRGVPISSWRR